jgi:hypothetical protein
VKTLMPASGHGFNRAANPALTGGFSR